MSFKEFSHHTVHVIFNMVGLIRTNFPGHIINEFSTGLQVYDDNLAFVCVAMAIVII